MNAPRVIVLDSVPPVDPSPVLRLEDTGEPASVTAVLARLALGRRVLVRGPEESVRRLVADVQGTLDRAGGRGGAFVRAGGPHADPEALP